MSARAVPRPYREGANAWQRRGQTLRPSPAGPNDECTRRDAESVGDCPIVSALLNSYPADLKYLGRKVVTYYTPNGLMDLFCGDLQRLFCVSLQTRDPTAQ